MALGRNTSACVAPDSAGEKPLAFTGDKGLIHHNAICNASWLRPDQFIGIGIFANACPDTTSPVIETARLRIGHAIAAVVIGGTSLSGGSGTMLGTIIGVFIMAVLKNGLMTIGIQQQWQVFFTGLAVLLAVMLDIYRSVKLKRS